MWIARSFWRNERDKVRGATRVLCPAWWTQRVAPCPLEWCWRTRSSTPKPITGTCAARWEPTASFRPNRAGVPRGGIRYQMYRAFPRQLYGPRAKIETVFSVIKRKLSTKAPGRSSPMQMRQALLLGLAFNLYRLRHPSTPAGCKQSHFKYCVLEVRILNGLLVSFAEVRNL